MSYPNSRDLHRYTCQHSCLGDPPVLPRNRKNRYWLGKPAWAHKLKAGVPNHYARTPYGRFPGNLRDLVSCFLIIVDYEISQIPWVLISLDVDLLLLLVHCQFACRQHCAGSFAVGRED